MPALVADLGAVSAYAWPFVAFTAATVVGTVLGGRRCDARGPREVLLGGPVCSGSGCSSPGPRRPWPSSSGARAPGAGFGSGRGGDLRAIALVYYPAARPAVFA